MTNDPAARQIDRTAHFDAITAPRAEPPALPISLPSPASLAAAEAQAERLYRQDRAARIRRGACPECGERRCPRVGGGDVACVKEPRGWVRA